MATVTELTCVLRWHAYLVRKQTNCTREEYEIARNMYERAFAMYM